MSESTQMETIRQPTREELEAFHLKMYPKMMKDVAARRLREAQRRAAAAGSYGDSRFTG